MFGWTDYLLSLPIMLLSLFALGVLLIDLMLPPEWKWVDALTAFVGVMFATAGVVRVQLIQARMEAAGRSVQSAFMNSVLMDHFAIYFFYLFLVGAAITILISVRYLEVEREHHGEFYALILFSVVGMMAVTRTRTPSSPHADTAANTCSDTRASHQLTGSDHQLKFLSPKASIHSRTWRSSHP